VKFREEPAFVTFELEDFQSVAGDERHYGRLKMDVPPVASFWLLQLSVKDRTNFGEWINATWDARNNEVLKAGVRFSPTGESNRVLLKVT